MRFLLPVTCLMLPLPSLCLAAAPEPELAPAVLCQPRDGLPNVAAKLREGKEVRVAYFGGSITAQNGWRPKTLAWFQKEFPRAKVSEINAAIGGTGSDLGVFRYEQDVLDHKPDLVFVEFSVNDGGGAPDRIYRAMEGIVRKTWQADPTTDLCYVYTFRVGYEKELDRGLCPRAPSAHEKVAGHYGIPSINVALRTVELANQGKLVFKADPKDETPKQEGKIVFSNDGVHPADAGHEVYLQAIVEAMPAILAGQPKPHALKPPMMADNWEQAQLVPLAKSMLQGSWRELDPQKGLGKAFGNRMPVIWEGSQPGDKMSFKFRGSMVGLYDLLGPDAGQVVWTIDDKKFGPRPRFDSYCSYHRLATLEMASGLDDKEHTVTLEIDPGQPDRSSVLNRVRNEPNFDAKKYEGTNVRVGAIMMIGKLLP